MSYWSMSAEDVLQVLDRRAQNQPVDLSSHATLVETEASEEVVVEELAAELRGLVAELGDLNHETMSQFEAYGAATTHMRLSGVDAKTLLDPGFWRWLAVEPLFEIVAWRFPSLHPNNFGASSASFKRCVPYKLFLHGKISYDGSSADPYERAAIGGEDFWDSQLIAVDNGYFTSLSTAILDEMREREVTNAFARVAVRRVNRRRANQLPDILTLSEARDLVRHEFDEAVNEVDQAEA